MGNKYYSTSEVAELCGVSQNTIRNWIYSGKLGEVAKWQGGKRVFTQKDLEHFVAYAKSREKNSKEGHRKKEKLRALESVFGMLGELSSEQLEVFGEAVKRRPLFK